MKKQTKKWSLVYIDGREMFCALCRAFDTKQKKNGSKQWNDVPNIRCRPKTINTHLGSDMHSDALYAHDGRKSSYFDEEEKKVNSLKVFQSQYWLAKEEMPSSKIISLLTLIKKLGVDESKYFETRSEPVLRKMLLLIARTIVEDILEKIKESEVYGFLTDEVTDISNVCQLVSFVEFFDIDKGKQRQCFSIAQTS